MYKILLQETIKTHTRVLLSLRAAALPQEAAAGASGERRAPSAYEASRGAPGGGSLPNGWLEGSRLVKQ